MCFTPFSHVSGVTFAAVALCRSGWTDFTAKTELHLRNRRRFITFAMVLGIALRTPTKTVSANSVPARVAQNRTGCQGLLLGYQAADHASSRMGDRRLTLENKLDTPSEEEISRPPRCRYTGPLCCLARECALHEVWHQIAVDDQAHVLEAIGDVVKAFF